MIILQLDKIEECVDEVLGKYNDVLFEADLKEHSINVYIITKNGEHLIETFNFEI